MATKRSAKSPAQLQREIDQALGSPGPSGPRSSIRMVREREAARRDTRGLIAKPLLGGAEAFQRGYEFVHRDVLAGMAPEAAHDLSGSVRGESTAFRDGALAAQIHLGDHQDKSYAHRLAKAYGVDLRNMSRSHATKKKSAVPATYVKLKGVRGRDAYAVQLPANNQWGFELAQAEGVWSQSWPGGFGLATEWTAVPKTKVPAKVRAEMDWLFDA